MWLELKDFVPVATLVATAVTAWATYALVKATKQLAKSTDQMCQAMAQAHMVLSLAPHKTSASTFEAILSNTGNATAYDVIVTSVPYYTDGRPCEHIIPFQTLSNFRPGAELKSCIYSIDDSGDRRQLSISQFDQLRDCRFKITLRWKNAPNAAQEMQYAYELSAMDFGDIASKKEEDPLVEIMKSMQRIEDSLTI